MRLHIVGAGVAGDDLLGRVPLAFVHRIHGRGVSLLLCMHVLKAQDV